MFLDSVQFEKNSFINRNQVLGPQGLFWLSIPVRSENHLHSSLKDTLILQTPDWRTKHLKTIEHFYRKSPRFSVLFPKLESLYRDSTTDRLSDLCFFQLKFWCEQLGIKTPIRRSSSMNLLEKKSKLVLEICKLEGANIYLSGIQGRDYLIEKDFDDQGIKVIYQDFKHPIYSQGRGDFVPNLSVVDFLMNTEDPSAFLKLKQRPEKEMGDAS